jgi:predicted ATP-grasp superfamily ATP-dependent carboligase
VSQQLIGDAAAASPWPFGYCGSIGPLTLPDGAARLMQQIADTLVCETDLRGLFGIDFIWDGHTPWVVEVNPRYTASCEILELALRRPLLTEHWRACLPQGDPPPAPLPVEARCGASPAVLGKLIVYAREAVMAPDWSRFVRPRSPWSVPYLADVPRIGTRFEPGQPVCTVFASGADADECHRKLVRRATQVRRWLREGA